MKLKAIFCLMVLLSFCRADTLLKNIENVMEKKGLRLDIDSRTKDLSNWIVSNSEFTAKEKIAYVKYLQEEMEVASELKLFSVFLLHWNLEYPSFYDGNFDLGKTPANKNVCYSGIFSVDCGFVRARSSLNAFEGIDESFIARNFESMSTSYKAAAIFQFIDKPPKTPKLCSLAQNFSKIGILYDSDIGAVACFYLLRYDGGNNYREMAQKFISMPSVSEDLKGLLSLQLDKK